MEKGTVMTLADPIIEPVRGPDIAPQARLLSRTYIWLREGGDKYWGTVASVSRSRVTVCTHARFKLNAKVTVRFHFQIAGKYMVAEELESKVIWQSGDSAAFGFDPPLTVGSPALQKVPRLEAHLARQGAG
ncbi:MAG: hypothetical protein EPO02_02230 [Nitrospirae bacterium]|nr:MAG: hypothetical protein EPO02_02230 [Nitrospirota bacterium]